MKYSIIALILFCVFLSIGETNGQKNNIQFPDFPLKTKNNRNNNKSVFNEKVQKIITQVNSDYSFEQLKDIIFFAKKHCSKSELITKSLIHWLKENHSIYDEKSPTEVNQFRGFLISSFYDLEPTEELLPYLKGELLFGSHHFNIACAAHTVKKYPRYATELVNILERFLQPHFIDEIVDISTYKLDYPQKQPTKVQYEILKTLAKFGKYSYPLIDEIKEIRRLEYQKWNKDESLISLCSNSILKIKRDTPSCCRASEKSTSIMVNQYVSNAITCNTHKKKIKRDPFLIDRRTRKEINLPKVKLQDQDGQKVAFQRLKGKPFVLAFFYTSCTNTQKCANTVNQLSKLQSLVNEKKERKKVGIYGMTYDSYFDKSSIIKSYGKAFGIEFNKNVKFLLALAGTEKLLFDELDLKVNYGYGSINSHGMQLFIFDKKGKIAAIYDNTLWDVEEVHNQLSKLIKE